MRIGFGYDVHQLEEGRRLVLGGVTIPSAKGLVGHSDADVLCHAIGDALLGGAALGDLGTHFPNTDARFAGISSLLLLKEIGQMLSERGYRIGNIDATVVLEKPKIMPYVSEMRNNIAASLSVHASRISVKATTSEGLGFVGSEQGVTAFACALINREDQS